MSKKRKHIDPCKILVAGVDLGFMKDTIKHLKGQGHEVRVCEKDPIPLEITWSDLIWFEWCNEIAVRTSRLTPNAKTVCRLHSYEIFTNMPEYMNWRAIDGLIFVNKSVRDLNPNRWPKGLRTTVIPNGVDMSKHKPPANKVYGKKVAYVGSINDKKNPGYLLACFEAIHNYDPEFTFHIAGEYQFAQRIELHFKHIIPQLPFKVQFDGWVDDMPAWLLDKDYIINTSWFEGTACSVAEGIASGLLPLVYNWVGSENVYPDSRFNTLKDLKDMLHTYKMVGKHGKSEQLRHGITTLEQQLKKTDRFLMEVMG